jgi:hypothetical protein
MPEEINATTVSTEKKLPWPPLDSGEEELVRWAVEQYDRYKDVQPGEWFDLDVK